MNAEIYRVGHRDRSKQQRRRHKIWLRTFVLMVAVVIGGAWWLYRHLQPHTTLKQAAATTTHVSYTSDTTKQYKEPDFTITLPSSWQPLASPPGPYHTYNWQHVSKADGELITVYEDTIPAHFAVNRVLIVQPETDHLTLSGQVSDNCSAYTTNAPSSTYQGGAPAKWQGVNFLCDQNNQERDVVGTSSTDGINTVVLRSQSTAQTHKFFFTYTDHMLSPDYSPFVSALNSFQLQ